MPRNDADSHNPWGSPQGGQPRNLVDELGEKILSTPYNPYSGAMKLGAGSTRGASGQGNDQEFWMDQIQTSFHKSGDEEAWEHHERTSLRVRKAVRIPYLVQDHHGQLALDHLLVGYIKPDPAVTELPHRDPWRSAMHGVGRLGQLLMEWLYPAGMDTWGTAWPSANWPNVFDPDPPAASGYTTRRRPWRFRDIPCRVEKSLLITYVAKQDDATSARGQLLVGYEGGGGW